MTLVIPAIDLRDGKCVRLYQGSYEKETVYFEDPVKMAKLWRIQNSRVLHVVDLDAARGGETNNRSVIAQIAGSLDIPIQVGGGVRTIEDIEQLLDLGVYRVIVGTSAVRDPDMITEAVERFTCSRVVVGIDARDGEVRVDGWTEGSGIDAVDMALDMEKRGVRRIIYTDISRDGTLEGPNVTAYRTLGKALSHVQLTASGGVGRYQDLLRIKELKPYRVDSVIVGRALYENRFPCQQFWCWNYKNEVDLDKYSSAEIVGSVSGQPLPPGC
ncbi:MAG: 1-(5-phosphoribosyl)-5-[(5-phosphoribosylamino)methylideneamino]imidazole-4-carboxamide isomerase [Bacteroidota bacterium]